MPPAAPSRTEVTGPLATDLYDVWEPEPGRARGLTVALIHGGYWRATYDRSYLQPLADGLAHDGFHVANLEYSRISVPRGGWPGTGDTVRERLDAVRADEHLPDRVIVVGHSAGGHLALWLGSQGRAPWLVGAVGLAPAADLAVLQRLRVSDDVAELLVGCAPNVCPEQWADADPAVQRLDVPAVVLVGGQDEDLPEAVVDGWVDRRMPTEIVRVHRLAEADHFDLVDPGHRAYLLLLAEIEELALAKGQAADSP